MKYFPVVSEEVLNATAVWSVIVRGYDELCAILESIPGTIQSHYARYRHFPKYSS